MPPTQPAGPPDIAAQLARLLAARLRPDALDGYRDQAWHWPGLVRLADAEGVAGLLRELVEREGLRPPEAERLALERERYQVLAVNTWLRAETRRIAGALSAAGVELILLKGAALALTLFRDPGLRRMGDVDLLVRPEAVPAALAALRALGYAPGQVEAHRGSRLAFENEVMLYRSAPPETLVELHWQLFDDPFYQDRLPMAWFWARTRPADLDGVAARQLEPSAQLLHLCAHLALHHGRPGHPRLRWLHDIAALLQAEGAAIDWPALLEPARDWGLVLPLQSVLSELAAEPWRAALPAAAAAALANMAPSPAERAALARLTAPRPAAWRLWQDLRALTGWRRRLAFLAINLVPGPRYMRQRYGRGPLPTLYLRRWARGLRQLGRRG
ncbi:MAG: nucleotidyltransferase family protein [Caldilineae bacterium]|nr:nucleotidyltransferase family protein [Caldilineae bacterium]